MAFYLKPCPICETPAIREEDFIESISDFRFYVRCLRCGEYEIGKREATTVGAHLKTDEQRFNASSQINENSAKGYLVSSDDLAEFSKLTTPDFEKRAFNILRHLAKEYPTIGTGPDIRLFDRVVRKGRAIDSVDFSNSDFKLAYQLMAKSWSNTWNEFKFLLEDDLIKSKRFLQITSSSILKITPAGWKELQEGKKLRNKNNLAFIAMKYTDSLIQYSENWFESAIVKAGYEPKAMYSHEHTNVIDNEMKELIKSSKFVICDMTLNSRGAYYEAGYAHGLGIPVIFLCEKNFFHKKESKLGPESEGVHFDTNHYPFIEWDWDEGEKLQKRLVEWIEATIVGK